MKLRKQKTRFCWPYGNRRRGHRTIPTFTMTIDQHEAKWIKKWLELFILPKKEPVS